MTIEFFVGKKNFFLVNKTKSTKRVSRYIGKLRIFRYVIFVFLYRRIPWTYFCLTDVSYNKSCVTR